MPSTALISFQREACLHSLGQSVVGCLRCGHRRACQQYQHSCENRDITKRPHNFNNKKITNCHNVQLWWEHTAGKQSDVIFYMRKLSYSEIILSLIWDPCALINTSMLVSNLRNTEIALLLNIYCILLEKVTVPLSYIQTNDRVSSNIRPKRFCICFAHQVCFVKWPYPNIITTYPQKAHKSVG